MQREGSAESKAPWARLSDMAALITGSGSGGGCGSAGSGMANLATFLLRVSDRTGGATGFSIPRPLFALLIASMPSTCVNIDVNTQGHDFAEPGAGLESGSGSGGFAASRHLCNTLRAVLPRLHHLRLRIKVLCPAVFAAGYRAGCTTDDDNNDDDDDEASFAGPTAAAAASLPFSDSGCSTCSCTTTERARLRGAEPARHCGQPHPPHTVWKYVGQRR